MTSSQVRTNLDLRQIREDCETGATEAKPKELVDREESFTLKYTAPDGVLREATLVSRIKTAKDRLTLGRMAATLSGGAQWSSLPAMVAARIWAIANLTVQLADPPDWVLHWAQEDDDLLYQVANELEVHESRYFRGDDPEGNGEAQASRVVIGKIGPAANPDLS